MLYMKKMSYVDYEDIGVPETHTTGTTIELDVADEEVYPDPVDIVGFNFWIWKFNIYFKITKD